MPAPRLLWFKVWIGATADRKVRTLDDATFRTWVELLDAAAQQSKRGRFASRAEAAAITRRPVKHLGVLIAATLIDETPEGLTMHDWDDWQRWRKGDTNDNGTTTEQPPDPPPNGHVNNSRTTHERLPDEPLKDAGTTDALYAHSRRREKREREIEGDVEKEKEPETFASLRSAARSRAAPPGNPRVAAVIDAFRAFTSDKEPSMNDRDRAAIKRSTAPPELIAETYLAVEDGEWGDDFQKQRLSVHEACDWVNAYARWRDANGIEPMVRRVEAS